MRYEYKCNKCNKQITIEKPMKEASTIEHCECGNELQRIFNASHNKWNCGGSFARGSY